MRAFKKAPKPLFRGQFAGEQAAHFNHEMECRKEGYTGFAEFHHEMIELLGRKSDFYAKYPTRRARRDARKAGFSYE